jgi:WD repeat-containing protein 23
MYGIEAKNVSWSILDVDFSRNGEYYVYSTWNDAIFLSHLDNRSIDEIQPLYLRPDSQRFGVFTVAFSNCGKQVLAGANDGCLYCYDIVAQTRTLKVPVVRVSSDNIIRKQI